jgi:predicted enzyme related to lactoylglutathione lyase
VHPAEDEAYHEFYLMCDDIEVTVAELAAKGVKTSAIQERPWGRVTQIRLPSGDDLGLYQPKHPTAIGSLPARTP